MKKKIFSFVQLAIGVAILVYLFTSMKDRSDLLDALRAAAENWPMLAAGLGGFGICMLLCALRWALLLRAQDIHLTPGRILTVFFIGHFFNSFLFGVTGGDLVKAYIVAVEAPEKRTEAVTTVFIDRLVGMLGLVLLTVVVMLIRLHFFMSLPSMQIVLVFYAAGLVLTVFGGFVVFRRNLFEHYAFFRRIEEKTVVGKIISRVYNAFHLCLSHRAVLFQTLAISLANHLTFLGCIFCLGRALGIPLPYVDYVTVFPIILAVSAVPLTPGGLGTREAMTKWLLGVLRVAATRAVPLSLLIYVTVLAWSLVGGIVYLWYAYRRGRDVVKEVIQQAESAS